MLKLINIRTLIYCVLGIALTQSRPSYAQVNSKLLPLDPAVRIGKLANGFTYYIRHNEEPKNRVVMFLANKVGSVLEDDDQQGLAHFMEHMSFNGTKHFPKNQLVSYLQSSGIRFGADLNAYTNFDETVYQLPLPSDNPAILNNGLQIMRDWAQKANLDDAEINGERGVVLEEKRLGKGAQERMRRQYWPVLLNNSRYARRVPIGQDAILNNFKPITIRRFYHDWYRPNLQALIVVGDVDVNQMERKIIKQFGDLKNPFHERQRINYHIPLTGKNHFITVTDPEMTSTVVQIMMKQPRLVIRTAKEYRAIIVRQLFNSMLSYRFSEIMQHANPAYLQVQAGAGKFVGNLDNFSVTIVPKPNEIENGLKAVWRELARVKRFGFIKEELNRVKENYMSSIASSLKEKNNTNSQSFVEEYLDLFLNGTASPGIEKEYELVKADLASITTNDVNTLARSEIKNTDRDILIMAPDYEKNNLPGDLKVNNWLNDIQKENLAAYFEQTNNAPLLSHIPTGGVVLKEMRDTALNITTFKLSNGVTVLLKPTTFKQNEIMFSAFSAGGTSLYSDLDYPSAAIAGNLIPAFGLGIFPPAQLNNLLTGKQAIVTPFISERFQGFTGASTPKDLETALSLVYGYTTEPRKDTSIFKSVMQRSSASLVNRGHDPNSVFSDSINAALYGNNIRRSGPSQAKLNAIDLEKAFKIYKDQFSDASGMTFIFVGNLDSATLKPLLVKYLGTLPSSNTSRKANDIDLPIKEGRLVKTIFKGSEPKAAVQLLFSGQFDYNNLNKTVLDALKECLEIRLLERLREDEGGVYSPSVSVRSNKYPKSRFSFAVSFGCAPQNVEKLIASVDDEISKLIKNGPSEINLNKWKAEEKTALETALQTNGFWLGYLTGQLQNEEDLYQLESSQTLTAKISVKDIQEAAKKYLNNGNYLKMVLKPEK